MVRKTFDDSKGNAQLAECLDGRGSLFRVHLHFFFFSKSSRKKAQVGEALFIGIIQAGSALEHVVGCPKRAVGVGGGAAHNRCFLDDDCL